MTRYHSLSKPGEGGGGGGGFASKHRARPPPFCIATPQTGASKGRRPKSHFFQITHP